MKKGTLAIIEWYKFYKREGRMPTRAEFMDLGYCSKTYYNTKDQFIEMEKNCQMQEATFNVR